MNSNTYDFGNRQMFANNANLNGANGYLYNTANGANSQSSPLTNNALLNSASSAANGSPFSGMNLSSRTAPSNPSNALPNNLSLHQYPSAAGPARMPNVSPSLNFASLYNTQRSRFQAAKGFDIEDDMEFCPEIHEFLSHNHPSTASSATASNFTHHRFNPYTSSPFSPQVSPTSTTALTVSPPSAKMGSSNLSSTPKQEATSYKNLTPRSKKVLEIVNPVTGLRVTSPNPYK